MSDGLSIAASTASPVSGPFVPRVQATGTPPIGIYVGSIIAPLYAVTCHPGIAPEGTPSVCHFSSWTLLRPHSFSCPAAHEPAALNWGELVRRGPYLSVRYQTVSMTLEGG